jgi:hypothetical protein
MDFVREVLRGLELLRGLDKDRKLFGAGAHGYELNPTLSVDEVSSFERAWRCRLPEEYRSFLLSAGNGGAGPYYGVFPLGMAHSGFDLVEFDDWGFDLSVPFPHSKAWNKESLLFVGAPQRDGFESEEDFEVAMEAWQDSEAAEKARDAYYLAAGTGRGSVPICHQGCGFVDWLVLTGPEAGNVWHDFAPDQGGVAPVGTPSRPRTTFSQWYLDWLGKSLVELGVKDP